VSKSLKNTGIVARLQQFYEQKLPYWIELMSYLGKIYPLITSVHNLKGRVEKAMKDTNTLFVSCFCACRQQYSLLKDERSKRMVYRDLEAYAVVPSCY
jgi:hypothetical protein